MVVVVSKSVDYTFATERKVKICGYLLHTIITKQSYMPSPPFMLLLNLLLSLIAYCSPSYTNTFTNIAHVLVEFSIYLIVCVCILITFVKFFMLVRLFSKTFILLLAYKQQYTFRSLFSLNFVAIFSIFISFFFYKFYLWK